MKRIYSRKRKIKFLFRKRLLFLLVIMLLFFKGVFVHAGMNDSRLEKNRMDGVYAIASFRGENHLYYLNMYTLNGIVSYCVELGKDITTNIYHSTESFGVSYLSDEAIRYIQSISYFGYGYPGHGDFHYYMAAQEIIWEYLSGGQIEWGSELSFNSPRINIDSYKNEILHLRDCYYRGLDFRFQNGSVYTIGDTLVLYEQFGFLADYEVETSGHSQAFIEGNKLKIEVARDYVGEERIVLKRKQAYSYQTKYYYFDQSQQLISAGNFEENRHEISFYIEGKDLNFQIIDGESKEATPRGQANFSDAVYELYRVSGEFVGQFVTNEYGKAFVDNLPYGDYIVRQISSSLGYQLNPDEVYISFNGTDSIVLLEEYPIYREVELFKVYDYEESGFLKPEGNVSFEVFDQNGEFYQNVVTNDDGVGVILLPYGRYLFRQSTTLFGYHKVDDFYVDVNQDFWDTVRINLIDSYVKCQLKIMVRDERSKEIISKEGFLYKIWDVSKERYVNFEGKDVFEVDSSGELVVPVFLGYGEYRIEEVEVPNGFVSRGQVIDLQLNDDSAFQLQDGVLVLVQDIYQKLLEGQVELVTRQEVYHSFEGGYDYTTEVRPSVTLDLVSDGDIVVYDQIIYHSGEVVQEVVTAEDGSLKMTLPLGSYCLLEKGTNLKTCFTLKDENHGRENIKVSLDSLLPLEKMTIQFHDKSESGEDIKGVIVEVKDFNDHIIYTGITDDDGIFQVKNLTSGRYCFSQKKIGSDFMKIEDEQCISINQTKAVWEVLMVNKRVSSNWIEVPNTLTRSDEVKKLGILLGIVIGGILYKKKYHCKHRSS